VNQIKEYTAKIEKELHDICNDILNVLDKHLLVSAKSTESVVFFQKMKGDYHRYLAEFANGDGKKELADKACRAYEAATVAATALAPTHPMRLGLALNFSVFYYEIMAAPAKACKLAKEAFDEAISETSSLDEDTFKDATLIMQLLRNNLTLWNSEDGNNDD